MSPHPSTIVATGLGAVSAVGHGCAALWSALAAGRDGLAPVRRFSTEGLPHGLAGLVPGYDGPDKITPERRHRGMSIAFALEATREAWLQAGLDRDGPRPERIALVLGASVGDDLWEPTPLEDITRAVADALGILGPRITVSTACTSSTNAIGVALDLLASGTAEVVIAGGTDVLTPETFAGFSRLGVLSVAKCAPFSEPFGTTLAEGAGFLVLESRASATRRSATPLAEVLGYGLSGDAFHETSPDPGGAGVVSAIEGALANAGVTPDQIGYVNAHGTGTAANDPAEWRAILRVFGPRGETLPVSSTKSVIGHAQGAAGVLEVIATILAMQECCVPQTLHFTRPRARGPSDPIAQAVPRALTYSHAVCTSSAFGGANAAVVIARPGTATTANRQRREVFVRGVGAVGPHGRTLDDLWRVLVAGRPVQSTAVAPFRIEELLPTADPRRLDPSSRFLTASAALALADARIALRAQDCDRAGLVVGATQVSPESDQAFCDSIERHGLAQLSASAFARMVRNAPGGMCSKLLALKGPNSTLDTGHGSGLVAIAYAAELLSTHDRADLIVAGGFDELSEGDAEHRRGEGAACAVLATERTDDAIRVAGWGLAGPGQFADAVTRAATRAGIDERAIDGWFGTLPAPADRPRIDPAIVLGDAIASSAAVAFVAAVLALRRGEVRTALVGTANGISTTCAILLTTTEHGDGR